MAPDSVGNGRGFPRRKRNAELLPAGLAGNLEQNGLTRIHIRNAISGKVAIARDTGFVPPKGRLRDALGDVGVSV
jgi:hypothetical protein